MNWTNREVIQTATSFSLIACCTVLPLSTALLSVFSISTLFFWLLSGNIKNFPDILRTNRVALLSLLLLFLFVIGLSYTNASLGDSLSYLKKYRELLFIPIVLSILRNKPILKRRCEYGFLLGCTLLLITSYSMYFSIIPSIKYGDSTLYHITHSYFVSILAFYAIQKSFDSSVKRTTFLWSVLFLLSVINIFYIAPGRTGMLVFFFLMCLVLVQRLSLLKQTVCFLLLVCTISLTYITSDNFKTRSQQAIEEIKTYEYGASRTSLGMRFDWWINSIKIIKEKPLLGYGTGSFEIEHDRFINGSKMVKTDNPHNEYLLIGIQLGFTGLAIFVLLFLTQLYYSIKLERSDAYLVQGVIIAMIIGCSMNSFLFDTHQGHFWAILSAIYFSGLPQSDEITR